MSCYCKDEDHELCYDGVVGLFDSSCSCCKETKEYIERKGKGKNE